MCPLFTSVPVWHCRRWGVQLSPSLAEWLTLGVSLTLPSARIRLNFPTPKHVHLCARRK